MSDSDDTDETDGPYTIENADATQPPERLGDAMDSSGECLNCGEEFDTFEELHDHSAECGE